VEIKCISDEKILIAHSGIPCLSDLIGASGSSFTRAFSMPAWPDSTYTARESNLFPRYYLTSSRGSASEIPGDSREINIHWVKTAGLRTPLEA
jgi:hypothetical protein